MNTHDIEPMKYGVTKSDDYVTGWNDCYAAIEADRQRRGEPVAWHTEDHLTDKSATTYDPVVAKRWLAKGWPVSPLFQAPQPAESVKVPSDAEILALAASEHLGHFDKHGKLETCWSQPCDIDDEVLAFARTLLAKHGGQQSPVGYKLVPIEPTDEMIESGWRVGDVGMEDIYKAMLEAAPNGVNSIPPLDDESDALTVAYMSGLEEGKKHNRADANCYRFLRSMPMGIKILTQVAPGEWEEILSGDELDGFLKEYPR